MTRVISRWQLSAGRVPCMPARRRRAWISRLCWCRLRRGVLCALGLLLADVAVDFSRSVMRAATDASLADLRAVEAELLALANDELAREDIAEPDRFFTVTLDMRYQGQAYELNIPYSDEAVAAFHEAHEGAYGHAMRWRTVEIVSLRVKGRGLGDKPEFAAQPETPYSPEPIGEKPSPLGGTIRLFDREALLPGAAFAGEALVFQLDSNDLCAGGLAGARRWLRQPAAGAQLTVSRWRPRLQFPHTC